VTRGLAILLCLVGLTHADGPQCAGSSKARLSILLDGSETTTDEDGCDPGSVCSGSHGCLPRDSVVARREPGEDSLRFLRRAGNALTAQGRSAQAVPLLLRSMARREMRDSIRLELAQALFHSGKFEEGLEVNYGLDSAKAPLLEAVLRQRRDFFTLLDMPDEAAKAEARLILLNPASKPASRWRPRVRVGWQLSRSDMVQDTDTSGLKDLFTQWLHGEGSTESQGPAISQNRIRSTLTQGWSQIGNARLSWSVPFSDWIASLATSGSAAFTSDLSSLRWTNGTVQTDLSHDVLGIWTTLGGSFSTTRYTGSSGWWSRSEGVSLRLFRDIDQGWLSAQFGTTLQSTASQPDGVWNWQSSLGASRKVPWVPWLEAGIQGSLLASWQPASEYATGLRIHWASGLDATKSNKDASIVHYRDSTGNLTESVHPFYGISTLTYHTGRSQVTSRTVLSQLLPGLNLDLNASLPAGFSLTANASATWIHSLGKNIWCKTSGAATEEGDLLVWEDTKTGKRYLFASATSSSKLEEFQVHEESRTDLLTSLSVGTSWSSRLLGTFAISANWSWAEISPYELDPTSRYRTTGWSTAWSRTW
jgi:hypothetical protein